MTFTPFPSDIMDKTSPDNELLWGMVRTLRQEVRDLADRVKILEHSGNQTSVHLHDTSVPRAAYPKGHQVISVVYTRNDRAAAAENFVQWLNETKSSIERNITYETVFKDLGSQPRITNPYIFLYQNTNARWLTNMLGENKGLKFDPKSVVPVAYEYLVSDKLFHAANIDAEGYKGAALTIDRNTDQVRRNEVSEEARKKIASYVKVLMSQ
jgi:hypothetical protein